MAPAAMAPQLTRLLTASRSVALGRFPSVLIAAPLSGADLGAWACTVRPYAPSIANRVPGRTNAIARPSPHRARRRLVTWERPRLLLTENWSNRETDQVISP